MNSNGASGPWVTNKTTQAVLSEDINRYELITIGGPEVTTVISGWAEDAVFSKDGQRLAYFLGDYNSRLKVFELGENKNIDIASFAASTTSLGPLFWNADSSSLIYQRMNFNDPQDDSIWIVPAEPNQSPIELFSPAVLVDVVPMPAR